MLRRSLALIVAAAAAAGATAATLTTLPAEAAPARVVLTLRTSAPQALASGALRPPQDARERTDRAAAVAPTRRAMVERWLTDNDFTIEATTAWTVTARGPAHRVTRRLPPALRPSVLSAVREAAAPMRPRTVPVGYDPAQLRSAYDVAGATAHGRGTTVATIQFSGWQASDAEVFARAAGIPLRRGQITSIPVAGARTDRPDGLGGDFEVALDVEAALGAAPAADQRVYVAPNSTSGAIAAYDAVATDAERIGLTAVSISWGACEQAMPPSLVQALEQSLARMVAAGTTVFAASGDVGAYGCATADRPDGRLAVDYPASSPSVIAVGGTTLRQTETGWSETAWSDRSGGRPGYAGSGTGGGLSTLFPRPVWQPGAGRRAVPDLAAVADPRTGMGIYGPEPGGRRGWVIAGGTSGASPLLAGQLASTVSGLGRTLGFGRLHVPLYAAARDGGGVRDIVAGDNLRHRAAPGYDLATGLGSPQWGTLGPRLVEPALAAPPASRDLIVQVTPYAPVSRSARYGLAETVEAACAQDLAAPPTVLHLADAPDRVTSAVLAVREGEQCRTTLSPLVLDRAAPAASAALRRSSRPGVLALSWGGSDPAPSSGLGSVTWRLRRTDTGQVVAASSSARSGGGLRSGVRGVEYQLEVDAVDALGSRSGTAYSTAVTA